MLARRQEEEDRKNEIKIEWQHCALVIDRFLAETILTLHITVQTKTLFAGSYSGSSL